MRRRGPLRILATPDAPMHLTYSTILLAPAETSAWSGLTPWLLVLAVLMAGGGLACLWALLQRQAELVETARRQETELGELRGLAAGWIATREGLDLRRIEHVLVDLRDAQQRTEDALLRSIEARARVEQASAERVDPEGEVEALLERVTNRLLSLGYERIQLLADREALAAAGDARFEIPAEARRAGVVHKGGVIVQSGRIVDVRLRPPYAMFP